MSDGPEEHGCQHWREKPPPVSVCNACPLTGYYCRGCPDYKVCPKAGLPKVPQEIRRWLVDYGDKESLKVPLPQADYNRDMQAYRILARTIANYEAEQARQRQQAIK